jgi:hypothetical protein
MAAPTQARMGILIGKAFDQNLGILSVVNDTLSTPAQFSTQLIN